MHCNIPTVSILLVIAVTAISTEAVSAGVRDRPFHVEANVGRATIDTIDGIALDETTTAYRLGTGYRALSWLGISASYVNLGSLEANVSVDVAPSLLLRAAADGFEITASGHLPLTDSISLIAEIGTLWWSSDTAVDTFKETDSGRDSTWGAGIEYAFRQTMEATASWRRFTIDRTDIDTAWIGMRVRFGDAR